MNKEKIIVKKEWNNSQIKVNIDGHGIYIEAALSEFEDRLFELVKSNFFQSGIKEKLKSEFGKHANISVLRYSFKKATIKDLIDEIVEKVFSDSEEYVKMLVGICLRESLRKVFSEMKDETRKVVT